MAILIEESCCTARQEKTLFIVRFKSEMPSFVTSMTNMSRSASSLGVAHNSPVPLDMEFLLGNSSSCQIISTKDQKSSKLVVRVHL
jgi:hypothetical protein